MQYKSSIEDKFTLKDKDRYVSVSPINLYDTLVKQTPDNCRYRSNKENKTLHNKKKSCELPGLRKLTSPKKDEPQHNSSIINQLIEQEERQIPATLRISQEDQVRCKNKNKTTNRVKKHHKQHNTTNNSPFNAGKQTDRLKHVQSNFKLPSNLSAHRLPTLTLHPRKQRHAQKESCFIEKMMIQRSEMAHCGSVVTLGLSTIDNYEDRYQRRR